MTTITSAYFELGLFQTSICAVWSDNMSLWRSVVGSCVWVVALLPFFQSTLAYCAPLLQSTTPSTNLLTVYVARGFTKFYECKDAEKPFLNLEQMEWEALCHQPECDTAWVKASCNVSHQSAEVLKVMRRRCRPGDSVCEVFADDTDLVHFCPPLSKTGFDVRLKVQYNCLEVSNTVISSSRYWMVFSNSTVYIYTTRVLTVFLRQSNRSCSSYFRLQNLLAECTWASNASKVLHGLVVFKSHMSFPIDGPFPFETTISVSYLTAPNRILQVSLIVIFVKGFGMNNWTKT